MKRNVFYLSLVVILSFAIFLTGTALANEAIPENSKNNKEVEIVTPIEMSDEEVEKEIEKAMTPPPGYTIKIKYNLHNQKGIDKTLLPEDYVKHIPEGHKVIEYIEWKFVPIDKKEKKDSSPLAINTLDIPCPPPIDGSWSTTHGSPCSGITQFNRFEGEYHQASSGKYWRVKKCLGKWTRSSSSYDVHDCRLKIWVQGYTPCSYNTYTLYSYYFHPTWYGNKTNWWYINGKSDMSSKPVGTLTRSDVYKNGDKIKSGLETSVTPPN